jgi:hypothetical protein
LIQGEQTSFFCAYAHHFDTGRARFELETPKPPAQEARRGERSLFATKAAGIAKRAFAILSVRVASFDGSTTWHAKASERQKFVLSIMRSPKIVNDDCISLREDRNFM